MSVWFEILGKIVDIGNIAKGRSIRELKRLNKTYGKGRWRKMKGGTLVRLPNGAVMGAELHWYEAHGIGRKEFKIKRFFEGEKL